MSDILNLIKSRRSVRKYKDKCVEKDKIKKVMEAARWAPSSRNSQPWKFFIMETKGNEETIKEIAYGREFVSEAPLVIVACGDEKKSNECMSDVAFAMENIVLEAHSLGLGTCIIGYFDRDIAKKALKIDEKFTVFYMITLGYTDEKTENDRKPITDVYTYMGD